VGLGLPELRGARELLYFLAKRELLIRYKQSIFGISWAVLQPLSYAFLFALIFGRVAKLPSQGLPYPVFALAGIVPWLFVSQAVSQAAMSLVADANLVSKIYFPRLVLPVARILALLVDHAVSIVVLLVFVAIYGADPTIGLIALPGFLLLALVTAVGVGAFLAALNVQYRDVSMVVPLLVQLWLFATPVVYPGTLITGAWKYVYAVNPVVSIIEGYRWAFLGTPAPDLAVVAVSVASALAMLGAGVVYFRRTERFFADVV
jgi:lipopolysaccharide transport system permease protein